MEEKRNVTIEFWALKEERKKKGITQLQMSELLCVSLQQYKNYENNFVKMTKKRVIEICNILDIEYDKLLHFDYGDVEREYEQFKKHRNRKKEYIDKLTAEFRAYHRAKVCNMPKLRYVLNNNNLYNIRIDSGRSILNVAGLIGVSRQTYAKYEKIPSTVSEETLFKICNLFKIEKEDIVSCDICEMIKKEENERLNALKERTEKIRKEYEDIVDEVNMDYKGKILFAFV